MSRTAPTVRAAIFLAGLLILSIAPARAVTPNDVARYIAGLPPEAGSPLAPFTRDPGWTAHARTLDQAWNRIEQRQLRPIRAWSKKHLPEHRDFMLYMFSGPDFLYADAFYPHASTYVFSALEPVGGVPDLTRMPYYVRAAALQELRASMQTVLSYSFFRTKQMKVELQSGSMQGALPLLYVFLARAGNRIEEVSRVSLKPDGTLADAGGPRAKGSSDGVRIVFTGANGKTRRLYYFQTDLSNAGLAKSGFRAFCDSLGPADSLVKSASYLLHGRNFSMARDYLLSKSAAIIQDASGIPLRAFDRAQWELHPFGRYTGPIELFADKYQPDMARLFRRSRIREMNFGIGYKWRTHETHLLLAISREAPKASAGTEAEAKAEALPDSQRDAQAEPKVKRD